MIKKPIKSSSGQYLLNLGCGSIFSSEWNNLDLYHSKDVVYHDLNRGIPYADKLRHDKIEKGPVESQDLLYLIQYALPTQATTSFEMLFSLKNGYIPKSSAQVTIDREKRKLGLKEFSLYNSGVEDVLRGGQLEMLKLLRMMEQR